MRNVFKVKAIAFGGMALAAAGVASAQTTFDTTDVLAGITAATVAVGAIGAAIVTGPKIVKAAWGWIRGTVR